MGHRGKRIEIEKNLKDRGDSQKLYQREKDYMGMNRTANLRRPLTDCGDIKGKKIKPVSAEPRPRSLSPRLRKHHPLMVSQATNTSLDGSGPESTMDERLDYRTRIRDRYTKRSKDLAKLTLRKHLLVNEIKSGDVIKIQSSEEKVTHEKFKVPAETKSYDSMKPPKRKPIIKTITSKRDAVRVYKAVTFMDTPPMNSLQIKVPRAPIKKGDFKSRIPKRVKTSNQQIEPKPKKKGARFKHAVPAKVSSSEELNKTSPLISAAMILSPPTEIAKWSTSQNSTMPYYEAWVNTTLAAISKFSKKDRQYLEEQNIMQMFKKQLDYRPDRFYPEMDDVRYTGKITVKQR